MTEFSTFTKTILSQTLKQVGKKSLKSSADWCLGTGLLGVVERILVADPISRNKSVSVKLKLFPLNRKHSVLCHILKLLGH